MAATTKRTNKTRLNLTIAGDAARAGKKLARRENRSFSNWLEVLITREREKVAA